MLSDCCITNSITELFCSHHYLVKLIRNVGQPVQAIMFWLATTLQSSIHHSIVWKIHCLAQTSSMETDRHIKNSLVRRLLAHDSKREEIQISDWSLLSPLCHTIPPSFSLFIFPLLTLLLFLQKAGTLGQPHAHDVFVQKFCRK